MNTDNNINKKLNMSYAEYLSSSEKKPSPNDISNIVKNQLCAMDKFLVYLDPNHREVIFKLNEDLKESMIQISGLEGDAKKLLTARCDETETKFNTIIITESQKLFSNAIKFLEFIEKIRMKY